MIVRKKFDSIFLIIFLADCRVLSMEILPITKYNTSPAIIYGYAKTTGMSVCVCRIDHRLRDQTNSS